MKIDTAAASLKFWYGENKRSLPWREQRDPYLIWISEVMLQQTTVQAVIPYFLRFREKFPSVSALANAPLEQVLENWAGLGYYSRARNLHRAAKALDLLPAFPRTATELIQLPGFGDYTSRAVSSIAFDEPVGVVDGNVIRILSRLMGQSFLWWQTSDKKKLQSLADEMVKGHQPSVINQAMMELGATICTPTSPACLLCPWMKICEARKSNKIDQLPVKRPRREEEIIALDMNLIFHKKELALMENESLPFLKNTLLPPIEFKRLKAKPKHYDFQHSITHYKIFVCLKRQQLKTKSKDYQWHPIENIAKINPSSLLQKALNK